MLDCIRRRTNVTNVTQMQNLLKNGDNKGRYKVSSNFLIEHFDELSNRKITNKLDPMQQIALSHKNISQINPLKRISSAVSTNMIHFENIDIKIIGETFISKVTGGIGFSRLGIESLNQKLPSLREMIKTFF